MLLCTSAQIIMGVRGESKRNVHKTPRNTNAAFYSALTKGQCTAEAAELEDVNSVCVMEKNLHLDDIQAASFEYFKMQI